MIGLIIPSVFAEEYITMTIEDGMYKNNMLLRIDGTVNFDSSIVSDNTIRLELFDPEMNLVKKITIDRDYTFSTDILLKDDFMKNSGIYKIIATNANYKSEKTFVYQNTGSERNENVVFDDSSQKHLESIYNLKKGQWAKYLVDFYFFASNSELEQQHRQMLDESISQYDEFDIKLEDLEWIEIRVLEVDNNEIVYSKLAYTKDKGITNMGTYTATNDSQIRSIAIPKNIKIHDEFFAPEPFAPLYVTSSSSSSEDPLYQTRDLPNFEFFELESENEINVEGNRLEPYAYQKFEKSTGILVESEVGISMITENGETVDVYLGYYLESLSEEHLDTKSTIDFNSLNISDIEMKFSDISKKNKHSKFFLGEHWITKRDGIVVNNYEVYWSENNTYVGKILVGGDSKVTDIAIMTIFDPSNPIMLDVANDFILEMQLRLIPDSMTESPSILWISNPDEIQSISKIVGDRKIGVHSNPNFLDDGNNMFVLTIDYTGNHTELSPFESEASIQPSKSTSPNVSENDTEYGPEIIAFTLFLFVGLPALIIFVVIWKIRTRKK